MASYPPGKCCGVGVKHEGTAEGEVKTLGGVRTYLTYPKDKSTHNAILILTDVMGMDSINVQLIADQFAANGYFTAIPDLFNGNVVPMNPPADFDIMKWLGTEMPHVPAVDPIVEAVIKDLRGNYGVKRLGSAGYCFGAKYVCRWLKGGKLDVGYVAHPSFVNAEELEGIEGPLSIAAAETDSIFPAEKRHESEKILEKHTVPYQINLFSDVEHGFAVRCDLSKKRQKFAKEQAFCQAVSWFDEYLQDDGAAA
ncbi:alpha/beta-hydrolase [Aaosphaeria arxii CBS 175.79]|uniref:Alpha/beta-hydrolase n=1 Tax=Aaosphaeria arxii CBS 175.79 TaxID=1450172 RepID=A0A6A5XHG9_9PLEO|nr:alpha/beta-hydrolase [Aaosphaeria arxii CBS 175.79]KAF2012296.1 alpha/beta-hydrolase [Aaosphaeria arxii CBS 175.79]